MVISMDEELYRTIRGEIRTSLNVTSSLGDEELMLHIEQNVLRQHRLSGLTATEKRRWVRRLYHSFRGLDVLQPLVEDRSVTEIMINSHEEVFAE